MTVATLPANTIECVDVRDGLQKLPDDSIDCVVTSPPYWGTRDYGVPKNHWPDGTDSALGLEEDFQAYVEHLCSIFDEIMRVLKPAGTVWVNLGDTYAGHYGKNSPNRSRIVSTQNDSRTDGNSSTGSAPTFDSPTGLRQSVRDRSLCQIPARFAIAMTARGWILRNDIVWYKPNHMPASAKNRFACGWEHLFLFTKHPKYYFDLDAVRVPHKSLGAKATRPVKHERMRLNDRDQQLNLNPNRRGSLHPLGRNPGDFWPIATQSSTLGHFAMFPEKLIERPILAGCPSQVCKRCGTPRLTRQVFVRCVGQEQMRSDKRGERELAKGTKQLVLGCRCKRGFVPGVVLDPFMGAGTTAVVARRLGRWYLGFELNPKYADIARKRLAASEHSTTNKAKRRVHAMQY